MNSSRREFLKASSVLALGAAAPAFWQRVALAAPQADQAGTKDTVLVVVQLTGGNDGLNTVIPFRDPEYTRARPVLQQPAGRVKKINDELAFHPSMSGFAKLLEQSQLGIVQGIGYPNPNRSHFDSMDIWHKASFSAAEPFGWLGRSLEKLGGDATALHIGSDESPLALVGPSARSSSLRSLAEFQLKVAAGGDDPAKRRVIEKLAYSGAAGSGGLLDLVKQSAQQTYRSAEKLRRVGQEYNTPVKYPSTGLAARMKLIAQLISADCNERVYYTTHGGFDTHSDQLLAHANLLEELSDAVAAFQEDIKHHGQEKRVLTMTFSEFGRRVRENGSAGTDHGAASQMFLIGDAAQSGPIGAHPSLTDLEQGDLKFHTDFRRVYATLLDQWLHVSSRDVLGETFAPVSILRTNPA